MHNALQHKNGKTHVRYESMTFGYHRAYFVKSEQKSKIMPPRETINIFL